MPPSTILVVFLIHLSASQPWCSLLPPLVPQALSSHRALPLQVNRRLSLRVNSLAKVMESNERQAGWGAAKVRLGVRRPSTKFADLGLGAGASGVGHLKANEKQTLVRVGQLLCIQYDPSANNT